MLLENFAERRIWKLHPTSVTSGNFIDQSIFEMVKRNHFIIQHQFPGVQGSYKIV